jgi:AraC family transcriptional regulator, transcriptional activator FtrA
MNVDDRDNPANMGQAFAARRGKRGPAVAVVVYDGITPFEFGVACDMFGPEWKPMFDVAWYRLSVCAMQPGPVATAGGFRILAAHGPERILAADTVIVLPRVTVKAPPPPGLAEILRQVHLRGGRIISLCTGAFILASAGLLDGLKATTHWTDCRELANRFPKVSVHPDVLFVDEGGVLTSAGSAASIDLCLHVIRKDFGSQIALQVARHLVVPPQRDGGQAQYIDTPLPPPDNADLFNESLVWARRSLDQLVTIEDLAARSAMSPRTFARRFRATNGTTPYQWLLRQRVQLAQSLLETSDLGMDDIAGLSGLSTAANLRKHFSRSLHTSPQAYRRMFQAAAT